jgi:hypothetical protein
MPVAFAVVCRWGTLDCTGQPSSNLILDPGAGTHNNLLSNINVGKATRTFQSGGANYRGAHSGEDLTHNARQSMHGSKVWGCHH